MVLLLIEPAHADELATLLRQRLRPLEEAVLDSAAHHVHTLRIGWPCPAKHVTARVVADCDGETRARHLLRQGERRRDLELVRPVNGHAPADAAELGREHRYRCRAL